jgi:hypothetical protein
MEKGKSDPHVERADPILLPGLALDLCDSGE